MSQSADRKVRFSDGVKGRFSDAERERLAAEFVERFRDTGKQFMEKPLGAGDVVVCSVTSKLFRIMLEAGW